MIKIDGYDIPTPSEYSVGVMDITKAERNANGTMIIEKIATKRKIELNYKYLSNSDLQSLLNKISPTFFSVAYPDSLTGAIRTATFYVGDRTAGAIDYKIGVIRWKDCKFNLIER
jgi:hypothetical protein